MSHRCPGMVSSVHQPGPVSGHPIKFSADSAFQRRRHCHDPLAGRRLRAPKTDRGGRRSAPNGAAGAAGPRRRMPSGHRPRALRQWRNGYWLRVWQGRKPAAPGTRHAAHVGVAAVRRPPPAAASQSPHRKEPQPELGFLWFEARRSRSCRRRCSYCRCRPRRRVRPRRD